MRTAICALLCCAAFQLTLGQSEAFLVSDDNNFFYEDVFSLANAPEYESNLLTNTSTISVMDRDDSDGLMEGFWDEVIYDEVGIRLSEDDDFFMDFDYKTQEDRELWENYGIPEYYIEKSEWFITEDWLKEN